MHRSGFYIVVKKLVILEKSARPTFFFFEKKLRDVTPHFFFLFSSLKKMKNKRSRQQQPKHSYIEEEDDFEELLPQQKKQKLQQIEEGELTNTPPSHKKQKIKECELINPPPQREFAEDDLWFVEEEQQPPVTTTNENDGWLSVEEFVEVVTDQGEIGMPIPSLPPQSTMKSEEKSGRLKKKKEASKSEKITSLPHQIAAPSAAVVPPPQPLILPQLVSSSTTVTPPPQIVVQKQQTVEAPPPCLPFDKITISQRTPLSPSANFNNSFSIQDRELIEALHDFPFLEVEKQLPEPKVPSTSFSNFEEKLMEMNRQYLSNLTTTAMTHIDNTTSSILKMNQDRLDALEALNIQVNQQNAAADESRLPSFDTRLRKLEEKINDIPKILLDSMTPLLKLIAFSCTNNQQTLATLKRDTVFNINELYAWVKTRPSYHSQQEDDAKPSQQEVLKSTEWNDIFDQLKKQQH